MTLPLRDLSPGDRPEPTPVPSAAGRRPGGLRALALATASFLAAGLLGVVVVGGGTAEAGTVGAGSYTETRPPGAALPKGCGDISTNPRLFVTADAAEGRDPHQRLVVVAALEAQQLRRQREHAGPPAGVPRREQRARTVLHHHAGDQRHRHRGRRVPLPVHRGHPGRGGRARRPGRQGRRLDRLDGHRRLERRHAAPCGPPSATACRSATTGSPAATRRSPPPQRPTVWTNSGSMIGFTRQRPRLRRVRADRRELDGQPAPASAPRWTARATSPSPCCPAAADRAALAAEPTAGTPTRTSPAPEMTYAYDPATSTVRTTYAFTTTAARGHRDEDGGRRSTRTSGAASTGGTPITPTYVSPRGAMQHAHRRLVVHHQR